MGMRLMVLRCWAQRKYSGVIPHNAVGKAGPRFRLGQIDACTAKAVSGGFRIFMADPHAYASLRLNSYHAMCCGSLGRRHLHGLSEIICSFAFPRFWFDPPFPIDGPPTEEGRTTNPLSVKLV